jgi:hypothetical protein
VLGQAELAYTYLLLFCFTSGGIVEVTCPPRDLFYLFFILCVVDILIVVREYWRLPLGPSIHCIYVVGWCVWNLVVGKLLKLLEKTSFCTRTLLATHEKRLRIKTVGHWRTTVGK